MTTLEPIYKNVRDPETNITRRVVMKPAEVKAVIMKGYGLKDTREYEKFYDIVRNRLRTYQALHGGTLESPRKFLYTTAKSRIRFGESYMPSARTQSIMATPSISTGRIQEYIERDAVRQAALDKIKSDFQGFINTLPPNYKAMATRLYNRILEDKNIPVKNYQNFLDDLAKKYKAVRDERGEVIPGGSVSGSGVRYESFEKGSISIRSYLA